MCETTQFLHKTIIDRQKTETCRLSITIVITTRTDRNKLKSVVESSEFVL